MGCTFAKNPVKTTHKYEPEMQFIKGGYIVLNPKKPANLKNNWVKIKSFWMAKTETSFAQWRNCFKNGGCKKDKYLPNYDDPVDRLSRSNYPVVNVSWYEANEYTQWLSKISGKKYRLPTEAEWLFAARAGKKRRFPWGDTLIGIEKCTFCNFSSGASSASVKYYKPYGGLYSMYGNVGEWTCSPSNGNGVIITYAEANKSPSGTETICLTPATYSSGEITVKGGSFEDYGTSETYADQPDGTLGAPLSPSDHTYDVGFRVVREE